MKFKLFHPAVYDYHTIYIPYVYEEHVLINGKPGFIVKPQKDKQEWFIHVSPFRRVDLTYDTNIKVPSASWGPFKTLKSAIVAYKILKATS
jgi:hypothetical protein